MTLDYEKMHNDIMVELNYQGKSQMSLARDLKFSTNVIAGIKDGVSIQLKNYLKLVKWLDKPVGYYIK